MISSLVNNIQFLNFIKSLKENSPYLHIHKVITTNIKHNKDIIKCTVMSLQPLQHINTTQVWLLGETKLMNPILESVTKCNIFRIR